MAGHKVTMVTTSAFLPDEWCSKPGWNRHNIEGIDLHVYALPYSNRLPFYKRIWCFLRFSFAALRKVHSISCDVVFATSTPLTIAIPGVYASRQHKVPMVFEVRDLWPELPIAVGALRSPFVIYLARLLEKWAYRNSTRIVALSPGMAKGVEKQDYPNNCIYVIPNSCDRDLFEVPSERGELFREQFKWLGSSPLIVYTGTLGIINGVCYLVDVAHKMRILNPYVRFLVVGSGIEKEKVEQYAKEEGVWEKNFFMLPPVAKQDLPAILSAADIAVSLFLPIEAMWHNSANKFFDALASCTPVAINYGGWQADILRESGAGVVMDSADAKKGAMTLHKALADPEWVQNASKSAHILAMKRFDRDKLAAKFEKILSGVAGSKN